MNLLVLKLFAFLVIFYGVEQQVEAYNHNRIKRTISESRMNKLETLLALSKMKKSGLADPDDIENQYRFETMKRMSDSFISGAKTKAGLNKVKGITMTMPVAGGMIDPNLIGRKRRSDARLLDSLFTRQSDDDNNNPLELEYDDLFNYNFIH